MLAEHGTKSQGSAFPHNILEYTLLYLSQYFGMKF